MYNICYSYLMKNTDKKEYDYKKKFFIRNQKVSIKLFTIYVGKSQLISMKVGICISLIVRVEYAEFGCDSL